MQNELGDQRNNCSLGLLIMECVQNMDPDNKLTAIKRNLEASLREKYAQATRSELKATHPMDVYVSYYKRFGYTYHVLPQTESIIKGKTIPDVLPLVEAMFIAELKNMLLTAGHDFDKIKIPLRLMLSTGQESYLSLSGRDVTAVSGDFMLSDQRGVISSILRGPDLHAAITEQTNRVLYTVYAPLGVEQQLIFQHLNDIESYVRAFSERAVTSFKHVFD
jgi:DNA/RNA-binding domain of Phe-tRNA-synthetase-like protein